MRATGEYGNFWKAAYLSVTFFLFYCPQVIVANIITKIMEKHFGSLGFILVGLQFLFCMINSVMTPSLLKTFGLRKVFCIGGILLSTSIIS